MSVFDFNSYKGILREQLKLSKTSYDKLCTKLGIAKPYLSRVFNHDAQLNDEQMYKCCRFFKLTLEETDYCQYLLLLERADNPPYQKYLRSKIRELQKKNKKLNQRLKSDALVDNDFDPSLLLAYYTNPKMQILHMLLGLDGPTLSLSDFRRILDVDDATLRTMLKQLDQLGIIHWTDDHIKLLATRLHLDEDDALSLQNHISWRLFCLPGSRTKSENDYRFTGTAVAEKKHLDSLVERIKKQIVLWSDELDNAGNEKVFQINFDIIDLF